MEPPPPPTSGRFRLRVQIYGPQDAHNLGATPLRQFTIVKNPTLPLPDLTLQQLCDEVVKRFRAIYSTEQLFAIDNPQDSFGSDLYFGDRVRDVFEDNEIFRVIKGSSYRASVEPHRARSSSVRPNICIGDRKRDTSHSDSFWGAEKRRRTSHIDPDWPVRSKEPDTDEPVVGPPTKDSLHNSEIADAQAVAASQRQSLEYNEAAQVQSPAPTANRTQAADGFPGHSIDRYSSNLITKTTAPLQHVNSPISVGSSSRDDIVTSGSDAQKATSDLKRKRISIGESDDQYRGRSVSTAMTTPLSIIQQSDERSPMNDSRRLKRTNLGVNTTKPEAQRPTIPPPRVDIYEVIETDYEDSNVKPPARYVSSKSTAPVGVSLPKFKSWSSSIPSSDNGDSGQRIKASSDRQQAGNMEQQRRERAEQMQLKDERGRRDKFAKQQLEVGQQKPIREDSENRRLSQQKNEKERQAKIDADRIRREKRLREEAAARREFEQEVNENGDAEVEALVQTGLVAAEAEYGEVMQVDRLADGEAKKKEEMSVMKKRAENSKLNEQELVQARHETTRSSGGTKYPSKESAPRPNGMLPRAVAEYDSNITAKTPQRELASTTASNSASVGPSAGKTSCTPFIPRGRLSGLSPTVTFSSQTVKGSSQNVSSPNVGLEAQMPLPKRRVPFADTPPSGSRRSGSTSGTMKQTTLVPPRLGITDIKITPKHALPKGTTDRIGSSNSIKGKAKVVESPGKPPSPAIVISDDEEGDSDSTEVYKYANFVDARHVLSAYQERQPWQLTRHIKSGPPAIDSKSAANTKQQSISPHISPVKSNSINIGAGVVPPTSRTEPALQMSFHRTSLNSREQKAPSPTSARVSPWKTPRDGSQSGSYTQTHGSIQAVIPRTSLGEAQEVPVHQGNKARDDEESGSEYQAAGGGSEDGSEEDSDEIEDIDDLESKPRDPRRDSKPKSDVSEQMPEAESEDADDDLEMRVNGIDRTTEGEFNSVDKDFRSEHHDAKENHEAQSNGSVEMMKDKYENAEEELENESGDATDQSDTNDEESKSESESVTTQAQLDNQLTQPPQSLPKLRQQTFSPDRNKIFTKQDVEAKDLRAKMPSLRRNLQEMKHTNQVNQEASKARNLANAQQLKDDALDSSEPDDSSDECSTSDQSSSSSEKAADAGGLEGAKIREELSSKIAELGHNSSLPAETHQPAPRPTFPRKETRILPPPKEIPQRQKVGFRKLSRQFTAKRPK